MTMPQAVQALDSDKRRALMQWLTRRGPFWEDVRLHSSADDLLECNGEMVTDTAVGEAAYCLLHGIARSLVRLKPSCWLISPLSVRWHDDDGDLRTVEVANYWDPDEVLAALESIPVPLGSWEDVEAAARLRCRNLVFADDAFSPLEGHPFGKGAAERILSRLHVLQELTDCFDERGERTPQGHTLITKHFMGDEAWFSDSSDTEKAQFKPRLTFPHPTNPGQSLFCTWHGKVRTSHLRIHFS